MTHPMQWLNALSTRASLEGALDEVVAQLQPQLAGAPDLGIVFLSSAFASEASRLLPLLQEKLSLPVVVGSLGHGLIGMKGAANQEIEQGPALSLTVAVLPGVNLRPFWLQEQDLPDLDSPPQAWIEAVGVEPLENPHFILLVDPMMGGVNDLLAGLDFAYPGAVKVGGLASGGDAYHLPLFFSCPGQGNRPNRGQGVAGLALSGAIALESIVAQGCRPIGRPFRVTEGERNIILEIEAPDPVTEDLVTCPPLVSLRELVQTLSEKDRELAQNALFVGVAMDEFKRALQPGDFLIRNLLGVDPRQGALAIGDRVRVGQRLQFHLRDGRTSAEDLQYLLEQYTQKPPSPGDIKGALMFPCLGRGSSLYQQANFDSNLFRRYFPETPLGGFFCNGEIGPVGGQTFLHGYTSVFGLIKALPLGEDRNAP
ncbi:MAG: FIST N-terminal domain-containing protein [Cyanobacteriota bacterium]|nr:FIST N-terminal domain-containing protein [Cyanobacteriota bacterium]